MLGLAFGGVYALSGVGLVVLYRATGVLNLAYGAIGALGALISWSLINSLSSFDFPDALAYVIALGFGALASLLYGVLVAPLLARRDPLVKMIGTLGFALILLGIMQWQWNPIHARSQKLPTTAWNYQLGAVRVSWTQIIALAFGIAMTAGIAVFLRRTKIGTAMRSLANDREITATLGVPVRRVEALAWLGSGLLCGAAGLLLADLVILNAVTLAFLVISSLAAALIGQLRSLWVTMVAALVIGVLEACGTAFHQWSPYKTLTPFILAIAALLWLGRRRVLTMTSVPVTAGLVQSSGGRWAEWKQAETVWGLQRGALVGAGWATAVLVFALVIFPQLAGERWEVTVTTVPIYAVVALGAGLLYGRVGLISLGQIALFAVGTWVGLRLLWGFPGLTFELVIVLTGLITMVIGVLVGLPALRLSGLYLALITLMAAAAFGVILRAWSFPNGGGGGFRGVGSNITESARAVRRPEIATGDSAYYRYVTIVCALMFVLVLWHVASRPGRAWAAIRHSEPSALAAGVNTTLYKLWAFALASFATGVAGALLASTGGGILNLANFQRYWSTQNSITLLAVVIMGGIFSIWGAVVAALFFRLLPALFDNWGVSNDLLTVLFGVLLLQVVVTSPGGLIAYLQKQVSRLAGTAPGLRSRPSRSSTG